MNNTLTREETREFLSKYYSGTNNERFEQMIRECKRSVIQSIVVPFGLGKIVAAYDRLGGNVDTVHNVRKNVYASEQAKMDYAQRGNYNSHEYHSDDEYKRINKEQTILRKDGKLTDYMTGEKVDRNKKTDLDHVVSAKEIHDDRGRVLAGIDGVKLANTETNLKMTNETINRSKKADSMEDFLERCDSRLVEIERLRNKRELTQSEQNELRKLEEFQKIDRQKAMEADKKARDVINTQINRTYYTSTKFMQNLATTSVVEGGKMGVQQALGLVLVEFFTAVLEEVEDIFRKGFHTCESFFASIKTRLETIASKVYHALVNKYRLIIASFKDGLISGILSNLVTTAVNIFATTSRRLVRIIREGIFSLFRALKMIFFPPEGLGKEEAWHEATKLFVSGVIVGLGILIEQSIATFLHSIGLAAFSDSFTSVFVGILTGISIAIAMYWLDTNRESVEKMRYEEIRQLCAENLPAIVEECEELSRLIKATHEQRLMSLESSFTDYQNADFNYDDNRIYEALAKINAIWRIELNTKTNEDMQTNLNKGSGILYFNKQEKAMIEKPNPEYS
ncbi:MAG: lactate permease [Helicobacter sp.]|nr:lactate permease [Helicobacter sp.]